MGARMSNPFSSRPRLSKSDRNMLINEVVLKPCLGLPGPIKLEEAKAAMSKMSTNLNLDAGALTKRICEDRVRHQMGLYDEWPGFDKYRSNILDANGHWPAEVAREGPCRIVKVPKTQK